MADHQDRLRIERALLEAAERPVQDMARNNAVVHRQGKPGYGMRRWERWWVLVACDRPAAAPVATPTGGSMVV